MSDKGVEVIIAVLLGVIAALIAVQLAHASSKPWPAAFYYAGGAFGATVLLALTVGDHLVVT